MFKDFKNFESCKKSQTYNLYNYAGTWNIIGTLIDISSDYLSIVCVRYPLQAMFNMSMQNWGSNGG